MASMKTITALLLLLLPAAVVTGTVDWSGVPTRDHRDAAEKIDTLPLKLEMHPGLGVMSFQTGDHSGQSFLIADLDGDGQDELIKSGTGYITRAKMSSDCLVLIQDQLALPREYHASRGPSFSISGPFDLDGDGKPEILVVGTIPPEQKIWGFWVVDPLSFTIRNHFTLDAPPERRPDNLWDGDFSVVGTLPGLLENPQRRALVVQVNAGFDAYGRGVMAVDPFTGEVLWHFQCGPKPVNYMAGVLDLDFDGTQEVVFLGRSPDNLHGELIGDYTDDQTRLFVLDTHGNEIWSRRIEGPLSTGYIQVGNLDEDPVPEIAVFSRLVSESGGKLTVWSPRGELLAETRTDEIPTTLKLLPSRNGRNHNLLVATRSGTLAEFRLAGRQLQPVRRALFHKHLTLWQVFQDPLDGRVMVIISEKVGIYGLLDRNLDLIAGFAKSRENDFPLYFFYAGGGSGLFCKGTNSTGFLIVHNPDALPTHPVLRLVATMPLLGWLLLLLLAVMVLGGWLLVRRHHREIRSRAVIPGDGNHLREARLHLLEDLELSGHGAIAPLRSLRRLLWLLDALKTGIEFNQEMNSRFREIWTDCHEDDLPRLLVILDRARAASLDNPSIETAAGALQKIQSQLAALKEDDFSAARLLASGSELNRQGETAETALQSLRREVANLFTADLEQVVRKVLRANHENIQAAGIQVSTGQQAQATGGGDATQTNEATRSLACRIDATELEFILDNLVGNAVRAMNGATERRLRLTWQQAGGMVKMEISDTGIGIATEDRDRILETPSSTKQRGGLGLPRSRRILRKYGGQLTIKSSSPGRGTTFQLLLAQVQH